MQHLKSMGEPCEGESRIIREARECGSLDLVVSK